MSKYKIGDRVIHKRMDIIGTIRVIDDTSLPYGVEFDDKIGGLNNLQGLCENGHGLWVHEEDIELLTSTLEQYTDEQLKDELDRREREKVIKELRKYIDKPVHNHSFKLEYNQMFDLTLSDELFEDYCKNKSIEDLREELENRKTNKIGDLINTIDSALNKLNNLGYKIPCGDNQYIRNLGYNSTIDTIMLFTLPLSKEDDK